jgi:SAM-dependent methyltransferase
MLLTTAPLQLEDDDLREIVLESPAGQRRRIDVEVGFTVFEVKRDLRQGNVRADAVEQLAGYVSTRTRDAGQRYVGVLTDGAEWHLYHLINDVLQPVSSLTVDTRPDVETLCVWLEGVLATTDKIVPTPREIERRLGAISPAHALDFAELFELYARNRNDPGIRLKRELWTKLLTTALGTNFQDEDALFVEHTLLVAMAEIIGHAVVGLDPSDPTITPATVLSGRLFAQAQIGGVIEADFFDWPVDVAGGEIFVRTLARRLGRFAWQHVEHDVMKVLYESVISAEQRHRLGEYYTPDWLAESIVEHVVTDPLNQRVLDPSCGSGTFLFHAVRRYLAAAAATGASPAIAIEGVTQKVIGLDVHPVAVTLARVTYLLAIGVERLQDPERPAFSVSVYLGDSMQWGQERTLLNTDALTVPTDDGGMLFAEELRFPDRLLADAGRFDRLVAELADRAANRRAGSPPPSLTATFRLFAVHPADQAMVTATFKIMCDLHDRGRDHIWGYYVRNLARPLWLSHPNHRVNVLVGNPPWLAYRFMTESMKLTFRNMSRDRGFWAGAAVATHQDLSALFVARSTELYLTDGGRLGFVMPHAVLSRRQYAGFRSGQWSSGSDNVNAALDQSWDLHRVKPSFFPVPGCVIFGLRTAAMGSSPAEPPQTWAGRLPHRNVSLVEALPLLKRTTSDTNKAAGRLSPYAPRFTQGASLVPRLLVSVEPQASGPLGAGAGRRGVRSRRSPNEKQPWKYLPALTGSVERQFVRPMHVSDTVLPFRTREPCLAVIPWDGQRLLHAGDDRLDLYPGLADWWRRAEQVWGQHRSSQLSLLEQVDYRRKLTGQFPAGSHRVVYSKGGMYMAATRITDPNAVIDHTLYWATAANIHEARYLTAIFNSDALLELVRPLQARGEHNPRHFDKYVFQVPIPLYDPDDLIHCALAQLATRAEQVAAAVDLRSGVSFQALRRKIRQELVSNGVAADINSYVRATLERASS